MNQSEKSTFNRLLRMLFGLISFVFIYLLVLRIIRHFYKFPVPVFVTRLIDKPWRYKFQNPEQLARWHGLQPGMRVLEVGPGNGTYTLAAARRVGLEGGVVALDIQPEVLARLETRLRSEGIKNVRLQEGDALKLTFPNASFDAIFMVTVIGEIPHPELAMNEFARVLRPGGTLAFSEFLPDPDYPLPRSLRRMASQVGLLEKIIYGNYFAYTILFTKSG